ncbi:MAG: hypothetical protein ABR498_08360 [Candidatus Dormibacteria bacterium]
MAMTSRREVIKFSASVALLGMLTDAVVGHAWTWENDPYWTYWVTKTVLILTVFGLGTAWFGIGAARGAVLTAVHTLILTIYYWSLSPVGLPSSPDWLDAEHTWVTGLPIHFAVIYAGYLGALWIWRRRRPEDLAPAGSGRTALRALLAAVLIVVLTGAIEAVALREFEGVTWYVTRLLVATPLIFAWWAVAGDDRRGAVGGAVVLSAILIGYGHFVSPMGLPNTPIRLFELDAPGAQTHWLTYRDEFLVAAPITLAVSLSVLLALSWKTRVPVSRGRRISVAAAAAVVLAGGGAAIAAVGVDSHGDPATVVTTGSPRVERGDWYTGDFVAAGGSLSVQTRENNPRETPLPPHDAVALTATVMTNQGTIFITAQQPMVEDALGRFTTGGGVEYNIWHHGRSGIGTDLIGPTHSDVSVLAVGDVIVNNQLVASGIPVHVMTLDDGSVELDVGQSGEPIPALTDAHIRAMWGAHNGSWDQTGKWTRYAYGVLVLLGILVLLVATISVESARHET